MSTAEFSLIKSRSKFFAIIFCACFFTYFLGKNPIFVDSLFISIKVLHVVAVISFMAGILYLPRLFVYHSMQEKESETDKLLKTMERKLESFIVTPALAVTLISGSFLAPIFMSGGGNHWLHAKLLLVVLMIISYFFCLNFRAKFLENTNFMQPRSFRLFNELPTLLMVFIVILVVAKPF